MSNNKVCNICYNKNTIDNLKCKTCKHQVCDDCYANIIIHNERFPIDFNDDKCVYKCPFCKEINIFSSKINNFYTNNKLIKLLLQKMEDDNQEFNALLNNFNFLKSNFINLQDELKKMKNDNNNLSTQVKYFKIHLEYKPLLTSKLEEVGKILNSSKNKNTILYKQINQILNE
jgi:hypothetical protein